MLARFAAELGAVRWTKQNMKRVTLDTNVVDAEGLKEAAQEHGFELARVTVTDREVEGTPWGGNIDARQDMAGALR